MLTLSGANPAVLRCTRCGRFVDWEEARLQILCNCKPHLSLPPVIVRERRDEDREPVQALFERDFGRSRIVAFGEELSADDGSALVAEMKGELAGALIYRFLDAALHVIALATDPMWQRSGVGGRLAAEAEGLARRRQLSRVIVATTNDNLPALYFYQRRGYRIVEAVPGGMLSHLHDRSVRGFGGIPIRDEIRLEHTLS
jgi:ribosomal protein S18 acetylase RimI-like enzyme